MYHNKYVSFVFWHFIAMHQCSKIPCWKAEHNRKFSQVRTLPNLLGVKIWRT